ncbi:MAG TPA: GTPase Era [Candidatus Binatus sp.]|nr:GTPase Era [Candidatus Binatus sp.]
MRSTESKKSAIRKIMGEHRAGFVALAGRTNVGKSTLLNLLVGQKVAIVTPRPQTTRRRILGIRSDADAQIILIDSPGLHEAKKALNQRMVQTARRAIAEGEVILAVVEAGDRLEPGDRAVLADVVALGRPTVVAINKVDRHPRERVLPLIEEINRDFPSVEIVPISALRGENIDELLATLKRMLPESPALMREDEYTDQTERMLAEEIIREKIFLKMREEIPFSTAVRVEKFEDDAERNLKRIGATVVVDRESHKGMLIGAGGRTMKEIGTAARLELEKILGARVFLEIVVKVERDWTRNPHKLAEFGL